MGNAGAIAVRPTQHTITEQDLFLQGNAEFDGQTFAVIGTTEHAPIGVALALTQAQAVLDTIKTVRVAACCCWWIPKASNCVAAMNCWALTELWPIWVCAWIWHGEKATRSLVWSMTDFIGWLYYLRTDCGCLLCRT